MSEILPFIVMLLGGYFIRLSLISAGQMWAKSYSQTISFLILPIITCIITKTIYGNIALSLGMIGALSIVRFRNPVKNPLELVIYFSLITIGIASSVKIIFGIALTLIIIVVLFVTNFLYFILNRYKKLIPSVSFGDGNMYNTVEVICKKNIEDFKNNANLINSVENLDDSTFIYRFAFKTAKETTNQLNEINKHKKNIKIINTNRIN